MIKLGPIAAAFCAAVLSLPSGAAEIVSSVEPVSLAQSRHTALELYVTSRDAAEALDADPSIVLIDVRTPEEFQFVGHASPADANIPLHRFAPDYNGKSGYGMALNPDFLAGVAAVMAREGKGKADPVFLMCRSGGRSAAAADLLAEAGYTNVWNVVDGFEGGKNPDSGHRTVEGWRAENLPWTYTVAPHQAYPPG